MNSSSSSKQSGKKKTPSSNIIPKVLDFSSQSQHIPNQTQQFPPYQHQQFPNPNQPFPNPNQPFPNPNQQLPYNFSYPHPFHFSYPHNPYNFTSTQSPPPYTNIATQPSTQFDSQVQSPQNVQPVFEENFTPITSETAEVLPNTQPDAITKKSFTQLEDQCLAGAFVTCSENPKKGRDQTLGVYWEDMTEIYNEEGATLGLGRREYKSLKNRFVRLKHEVQTWIEAEQFVDNIHHTGIDMVKRNEKIEEQFKKKNKKCNYQCFKCQHVLGILRRSSKFDYVTTRCSLPNVLSQGTDSSPSTPNIGSNDSPDPSQQYHSGDKRSRSTGEEVTSPSKHPARPIGNKAAKKGKAKVKQSSASLGMEGLELSDYLEKESAKKELFRAEKMRVFQGIADTSAKIADTSARNVSNASRRLEVEELKVQMQLKQLEQDRDIKVMQMKLTDIEDLEQREIIRQLQRAISAKWLP